MIRKTFSCFTLALIAVAGLQATATAETAQNTYNVGASANHQIRVAVVSEIGDKTVECTTTIAELLAAGDVEGAEEAARQCIYHIRELAKAAIRNIEDNRAEITDKLAEYKSLSNDPAEQEQIELWIGQINDQATEHVEEDIFPARQAAADLIRDALNN